jgi:hypothetical protein
MGKLSALHVTSTNLVSLSNSIHRHWEYPVYLASTKLRYCDTGVQPRNHDFLYCNADIEYLDIRNSIFPLESIPLFPKLKDLTITVVNYNLQEDEYIKSVKNFICTNWNEFGSIKKLSIQKTVRDNLDRNTTKFLTLLREILEETKIPKIVSHSYFYLEFEKEANRMVKEFNGRFVVGESWKP